jgi:hypothetical protein
LNAVGDDTGINEKAHGGFPAFVGAYCAALTCQACQTP